MAYRRGCGQVSTDSGTGIDTSGIQVGGGNASPSTLAIAFQNLPLTTINPGGLTPTDLTPGGLTPTDLTPVGVQQAAASSTNIMLTVIVLIGSGLVLLLVGKGLR